MDIDLEADTPEDSVSDAIQVPAFDQLPAHFKEFLIANNIPSDAYNLPKLYRFVRVNPRKPISKEQLEQQILSHLPKDSSQKPLVEPIKWMEAAVGPAGRFFRLDNNTPIACLPAYKDAQIYGIDIASAATVAALDVEPHHNVLDMCAAPLSKTAMIVDVMYTKAAALASSIEKTENPTNEQIMAHFTGSVTAVDVARNRMSAGGTVCRKYGLMNIRLYIKDATQFSVLAPDVNSTQPNKFLPLPKDCPTLLALGPAPAFADCGSPQPQSKSKAALKKEKKRPTPPEFEGHYFTSSWKMKFSSHLLYDRVLIDAQCSLDASVRHLLKYNKVGWLDFEAPSDDSIVHLQKRLIYNGFRLLAPGGYLIYSTCSFCKSQNERVVQWLLDNEPTAELVPIDFGTAARESGDMPTLTPSDTLPFCLRFYPKHSQTSGMFIAKIRKNIV